MRGMAQKTLGNTDIEVSIDVLWWDHHLCPLALVCESSVYFAMVAWSCVNP